MVFYQVGHGLVLALFPLTELSADAGTEATAGTSISLGQNLDTRESVDASVAAAVERVAVS